MNLELSNKISIYSRYSVYHLDYDLCKIYANRHALRPLVPLVHEGFTMKPTRLVKPKEQQTWLDTGDRQRSAPSAKRQALPSLRIPLSIDKVQLMGQGFSQKAWLSGGLGKIGSIHSRMLYKLTRVIFKPRQKEG